tara:strand:- start:494 stop:637 length:144 start_codon:yes stop_codon:yes gene_type:complete
MGKDKLKIDHNKSTLSEKQKFASNAARERKKRLWLLMNPGKTYPGDK